MNTVTRRVPPTSGHLRTIALVGLAFVVVAAAGIPTRVDAATTLKVAGSIWPPYVDDQLPEGGLAVDLVRTALARAGYDVAPELEAWSRAYEGVAVGVYDVAAAVWQTEARKEVLLFSEPYLLNDVILLIRRGEPIEFRALADLYGHPIGVVRGYAYDEAFDADPNLIRVANAHLLQNLLQLSHGKVDIVVGDKWSIVQQISSYMPDALKDFEVLPKPLARRALRIGVSRQNPNAPEIVAAFDAAIAGMKKDGTYDAIVKKHTEGIARLPAQR